MRILLASMLLLCMSSVHSQVTQPFKIDVATRKIYPAASGERKIEATRVAVGETIEYTLSYTNVTSNLIHDVRIALPVPNGFTYVAGSGVPAPYNVLPKYVTWSAGDVQAGATVKVVARLNLQRVPTKRK